MKKAIAAAVMLAVFLCGCGSTDAAYVLSDVSQLLEAGAFPNSDMAPVDSTIVAVLYGIDPDTIQECSSYQATNTSVSADEVTVLILTDEKAAEAAEQACRQRVDSQIAACQSYAPSAVPRLEQALISRRGSTVLLVVGDSEIVGSLDGLQ